MPTVRIPLVGKDCTKCGAWKEASLFALMRRNKNGLQSMCKACKKLYREANRERILAVQKKYRETHKEQIALGIKDWEARNKDSVRERGRKYDRTHRELRLLKFKERRDADPVMHKQKVAAYLKKNYEKFRRIFRHHAAMRRNLINQQQISKTYSKEIADFYKQAPLGLHVDHIVPIKGKNVCGLHVPWNLQYLDSAENRRKGNRYANG